MATAITQAPSNSIRLKAIKFSAIPFRKLGDIEFELAPRLTIIAGRNAIGKSTILALIANASGITKGDANLSYFGKLPQGNLHEIIHLSNERDYVEKQKDKPNVYLTYFVNGIELTKKCNISSRAGTGLRIVPRNEPKSEVQAGSIRIPAAGKIPLPTIYLGMVRMMPVGETEPGTLESAKDTTMTAADAAFIDEFVKRIIATGSVDTSPAMTKQWIKGTRKNSMHPPYKGYDSKAVSLGQDSLSAIATALASFQKFKSAMGEKYPGGLLVVDEIDAGFHPHAQQKLFQELQKEARRLRLQIVATTHSLTMISEAHQAIASVPDPNNRLDAIVYLQAGNPVKLLDATDYQAIHDDMFLSLHEEKPQAIAKVYVEDAEAALFLDVILTRTRLKAVQQSTGVKIKVLPCRLGCNNLMALHKVDDYFKTVVVVLDADTTVKAAQSKNVLRLPADPNVTEKQAPEVLIEAICKSLVNEQGTYPKTRKELARRGYSTDHVDSLILALQSNETPSTHNVSDNREHAKEWFNRRLNSIKKLGLVEGWVADNETAVQAFVARFTDAVRFVTNPNVTPKPST